MIAETQLDAMPPDLAIAEVANQPDHRTVRACHPALARHLLKATSKAGFNPGTSRRLPPGRYENSGIPHGWGFIYQQILGGDYEIPVVPVFVNTFYDPNPPSAGRFYDFGPALGAAVSRSPTTCGSAWSPRAA